MQMHGAETGRVKLISEPLTVYKAVAGDDGSACDVEQVRARFRWIPPAVEAICKAAADFYMRQLLQRQPSEEQIADEQRLLMISWALRIDDGTYKTHVFPFPTAILDKGALQQKDQLLFGTINDSEVRKSCTQADVLWGDYQAFCRLEFPSVVTDDAWEGMLEDAKKKSLVTLLSERGYWPVLRLARGLTGLMGAFASGNGGAGPR